MDLNITQQEVLRVLVENKGKWMGLRDIKLKCNVNVLNIERAVAFFVEHDLVYQPNTEGKITVSPDGIRQYELSTR